MGYLISIAIAIVSLYNISHGIHVSETAFICCALFFVAGAIETGRK